MFTHDQVWHGIDRLARERGLSASGLARRAGLDPTTFNPSKRVTKQSKPRWPSTESLAKVLSATETGAGFLSHFWDESILFGYLGLNYKYPVWIKEFQHSFLFMLYTSSLPW